MSVRPTVVLAASDSSPFTNDLATALGANVVTIGTSLADHAGATTVVHVSGEQDPLVPTSLDATSAADWDARCEGILRAALLALQAAHDLLAATGGRIVLVTATTGISGAPSIVPFVTAIEGVRAMAKSGARQWGGIGITVNAVLVPLDLLAPTAAGLTSFLPPPALGAPPAITDVAAAVTAFGRGTTGATVVVDGGSVMAP
jgi:3-oxoacyl-[acyl-carrier protein] reductase